MFNPNLFYLSGATVSLTKDLVGYYKFENNVVDSTGLLPAATGTGIDYVSGKIGQSVRFDANTDRVDIPDTNLLSFTSGGGVDVPFSMCMWVYFTAFGASGNWIFNKRNATSGGDEWQLVYAQGRLQFSKFDRVSNSITQTVGTPLSVLSLNTWYHIAVTDNGSKTTSGMKLYINGVSQSLTDLSAGVYTGMNNGTSGARIGLAAWAISFPHIGYLDETAIWKNRVLNQSEITYIYNSGTGISIL